MSNQDGGGRLAVQKDFSQNLDVDVVDYEAVLLCPACGGNNLHQASTDVYERLEDSDNGAHTLVDGDRTVVDQDMKGNPSKRRHGLTITFTCETCPAVPRLCIYQHKGSTFLRLEQVE